MFKIADYALPAEIADHIADELSYYVGMAARAAEETKALRAGLAKETETAEAYRFALTIYQWTGGSSNR